MISTTYPRIPTTRHASQYRFFQLSYNNVVFIKISIQPQLHNSIIRSINISLIHDMQSSSVISINNLRSLVYQLHICCSPLSPGTLTRYVNGTLKQLHITTHHPDIYFLQEMKLENAIKWCCCILTYRTH